MIADQDFSPDFIDRLVAGDRRVFGELVERTSPKIFALGLRMLGNEQDAEDMLQETYLKAFKALPNFEKRSSISTWLFRIAANEALMLLRKRKSGASLVEVEKDDEQDDSALEIVDWCCLPEQELVSTETREKLNEAAENLSPALRMVFQLRDVDGFSITETAEILDISEDAVKTRLVRARMKLREYLSVYFKERMEGGNQHA
jgi:RNA polymerase sigma-70 factor (ECF subfamily)